ncbi:hypothetical protein CC79DRAFT_1388678 [Sarocladium strictum]
MAPSETLVKTAKAYLDAISTVNSDALAAITTESFHVDMCPASTGYSGQPIPRDALIQRFQGLPGMISSMNIKIERLWPANEASNQVTVWTTAEATFTPAVVQDDKKEDWVYKPETVFIFEMDESGEKVSKLFEFQDSLGFKDMNATFGRAMERLGMGQGQ